MADSCQCMAKPLQYYKVISLAKQSNPNSRMLSMRGNIILPMIWITGVAQKAMFMFKR